MNSVETLNEVDNLLGEHYRGDAALFGLELSEAVITPLSDPRREAAYFTGHLALSGVELRQLGKTIYQSPDFQRVIRL